MNVKMIALDLDGTLLQDDKTIDSKDRDAILRAQQEGVVIVIATGRNKSGIQYVIDELQLETLGNNYIAGVNGQIIYNFRNKEYIVDKVLDGDDAKVIFEVAKKYQCEAICACGYDYYSLSPFKLKVMKFFKRLVRKTSMDYGLATGPRNFIPITSSDYPITQDVNKAIYIQTKSFFEKHLANIRQDLKAYEVLKVGPRWIEIMPKGVTKGKALLEIAAMNHIQKDEILAFGDAENDLSMMESVTYGIAVGNALDILKKAAYEVCDDHKHHGIQKTIYKYMGWEKI